jgi:F-type H+-transporting ATPase subunit b
MRKTSQKSKVKSQKFKKLILPLIIFSFAFASYAFGSGEEAEQTPLWKEYMWKIINFGVLVFILVKFAKKPLQDFLRKRTELIEKSLNEAKEAKEAALKALQAIVAAAK